MEVSPLRPWCDSILEDDCQKQTQVGWDSEADIIDDECDLPYPGYFFFLPVKLMIAFRED